MESDYREFEKRGVSIVFVMAQKIEGAFRAKGFVERHNYSFPLLFDEDRSVTKAYGVYHLAGIDAFRIARPAMFLMDGSGKVLWIAVSSNQFEVPATADVLAAIEASGKY